MSFIHFQALPQMKDFGPSWLSKFLACTMYWQFPDLPWQSSFPRLENHYGLLAGHDVRAPSLQSLGTPFVEALAAQWYVFLLE